MQWEADARQTVQRTVDDWLQPLTDETAVVLKTPAGVWVRANPAALRLFQLPGGDVQGKTDEALAAQYPDFAETAILNTALDAQAWRARRPMTTEQALVDTSGAISLITVTRVPVLDDGQPSVLVVLALPIVGQRDSARLLQQADWTTTVANLASSAAHEIRNPLSAIQWTLTALISKHPDKADTYRLVLSELHRIDTTVGQLLALSKSTSPAFQSTDVTQLLRSVVNLMATQFRARGVTITLDLPLADRLTINADAQRLTQVFINLLVNALDALPNGGRVEIVAFQDTQRTLHIDLADTGSGIDPQHLPHIGDPFFTTKPEGTGLGLMICRQIIADHGGDLHITSELNHGTTATITLPTSPSTEPAP